jgi:TRAP transporter 4TM/12TM fusion protein
LATEIDLSKIVDDAELDFNRENNVYRLIAIVGALFHLYTGAFGLLSNMPQRAIHLLLFSLLGLLGSRGRKPGLSFKAYNLVIIIATVVSGVYMLTTWEQRVLGIQSTTNMEIVLGFLAVLAVLEVTRRSTGPILPIIAIVFLVYAKFGQYFPGILNHKGYTIDRLVSVIYLGINGVYGTALGSSASFIVLFILFGAILNKSGGGKLLFELANALAGHLRGGPGKIAVVASGLMGMISGSPIANVVTTGTFTIPMMKKVGYPSHVAAAIEAVASCGGTLMPPIMGVAAFIMADYLGIPYVHVAAMALVPAILYYLGFYLMVDLNSMELGMKGVDRKELPKVNEVIREGGHLLIPIVLLVILMVMALPTLTVIFWSIVATALVAMLKPNTRLSLQDLVEAAEAAAKSTVPVASATACAGIVVGVVGLTGLGVKMASALNVLGGQMTLLALIFTAIAAVILGMGLPIAPVYIIMASLTAPALIQIGIAKEAAHFFIFYFAALATITPPVCLASYAAAGIAGADPNKTGWRAAAFAIPGFLMPFIVAYNPVLLLSGDWLTVTQAIATAILGVSALSFVMEGVTFHFRLTWWERIIYAICALLLIIPGDYTDIIGLVGVIALYLIGWRTHPSIRPKNSVSEPSQPNCV